MLVGATHEQLKEPHTRLICVRPPAYKNFLYLLLPLVLLQEANCIERQRLMRRGLSKQKKSNLNRSLKIVVNAYGIGNHSHHKSDEKQAAATELVDRVAVAPGVPHSINPAALEVAHSARLQVQNPAPEPSPPAAPPADVPAETDVYASGGAWLSGPLISFLILGCLILKCYWPEDAAATGTSPNTRRASLDAAAAAFTQRRPSAFGHKASSGDMHASRSSGRKHHRSSRDAPGESGSMAPSGSQGSAENGADEPRMSRHSSYRERRGMSRTQHSGESEASHAEANSGARGSSYRVRREASRNREARNEASPSSHSREASISRGQYSRQASASRGQAYSREPSATREQAGSGEPSESRGRATTQEGVENEEF